MDSVWLLLVVVFFALSLGLIQLFDHLQKEV
jgi:hypothetical protein